MTALNVIQVGRIRADCSFRRGVPTTRQSRRTGTCRGKIGVVVIVMNTDNDPDGVSRSATTSRDRPVEDRELLDDQRLTGIVSTLGDLPALPDVALRALRQAEDPEWDLKELTGTIGRDQGLAAEFLRLANSAFFGGTGTISTLDHAICRVGNTRVQSILLATVLEGFHATTQSNFKGTELWEHALVAATVSRYLATVYRRCDPEEAFIAGLLHDVGRPVMDREFPEQYGRSSTS